MSNFSAEKYLSELWRHVPANASILTLKVPKLKSAPVTLADHIAAEAEARRQAEARIINGPDFDQMPELQDDDGVMYYQHADAMETRSWAMDVEQDVTVWEYVAQQLLDFKFPAEAKKSRASILRSVKKFKQAA